MKLEKAKSLVLEALSDGETKHGYQIKKTIQDTTGLEILVGTLYRTIGKLEESGEIEQVPTPADGTTSRRYYRLARQ